MSENKKEYHKDGFVSHESLGAKYNMTYLLNKVVDFEIKTKSQSEFDKKVNQKTEQFKAIIGILALTGCRVSEALALKYDDLILEQDEDGKQWFTITLKNLKGKKNGKSSQPIKRVPILLDSKQTFFKPFIKPVIKWYLTVGDWYEQGIWKNTSFLIFENWSRFMVYNYCYSHLGINPHGFRKIYTEYLVVDKNYPIKVVQRIIGHRDLKNLDYYINLRTEDIKKAISERTDNL
jgi:integrase